MSEKLDMTTTYQVRRITWQPNTDDGKNPTLIATLGTTHFQRLRAMLTAVHDGYGYLFWIERLAQPDLHVVLGSGFIWDDVPLEQMQKRIAQEFFKALDTLRLQLVDLCSGQD